MSTLLYAVISNDETGKGDRFGVKTTEAITFEIEERHAWKVCDSTFVKESFWKSETEKWCQTTRYAILQFITYMHFSVFSMHFSFFKVNEDLHFAFHVLKCQLRILFFFYFLLLYSSFNSRFPFNTLCLGDYESVCSKQT